MHTVVILNGAKRSEESPLSVFGKIRMMYGCMFTEQK
jgi:hypothetical protein